jgi:hypothetical protein
MADQVDAEIRQIIRRKARQDLVIDCMVEKGLSVLFETKLAQPDGDVGRHCGARLPTSLRADAESACRGVTGTIDAARQRRDR